MHYEALRVLSLLIPKLKFAVRLKVLFVVVGCFAAHTIEVWMYAVAYLLIDLAGLGSLKASFTTVSPTFCIFPRHVFDPRSRRCLPLGALRLISGVEGINGLFLIAWSTSFTYFVMDRLWPLHGHHMRHKI